MKNLHKYCEYCKYRVRINVNILNGKEKGPKGY